MRRHRMGHLPELLQKSHAVAEVARADDLLEGLRALQAHALSLLEASMTGELEPRIGENGRALDLTVPMANRPGRYALPDLAIKAMKEARANYELLAILEGELPDAGGNELTVTYVNDWRTGAN